MRRSGTPIFSLLLVLVACAEAQKVPPADHGPAGPSAKALFPLAVGNRWSYRATFLGATQDLTVSIVGGEDRAFRDSRGQLYHIGPDGLRDGQRYLLREPIGVGTKWSSVIDVGHTEYYRIAEVGTAVDVPAGHFAGCVVVEAAAPETPEHVILAEQTYCPGVGLVRVVTYAEIDGKRGPPQFNQALVSYQVKQ